MFDATVGLVWSPQSHGALLESFLFEDSEAKAKAAVRVVVQNKTNRQGGFKRGAPGKVTLFLL